MELSFTSDKQKCERGFVKKNKKFWTKKLEKAFAKAAKIQKTLQKMELETSQVKDGYLFLRSSNVNWNKREKITLERKLKMLQKTKIPYYLDRINS